MIDYFSLYWILSSGFDTSIYNLSSLTIVFKNKESPFDAAQYNTPTFKVWIAGPCAVVANTVTEGGDIKVPNLIQLSLFDVGDIKHPQTSTVVGLVGQSSPVGKKS